MKMAQSKFFGDDSMDTQDKSSANLMQNGFKTASGNGIAVNNETVNMMKTKLLNDDPDPHAQSMVVGFSTGKGNNISIKKDAFEQAKDKIYKDENAYCQASSNNLQVKNNNTNFNKTIDETSSETMLNNSVNSNLSHKIEPKLSMSINLPMERPVVKKVENRNAKSYKKPKLIIKSKMNKYIDSEDPVEKNETTEINNNTIKSISSSESSVKETSISRMVGDENIFFVTELKSSGIIRLKGLNIDRLDEDREVTPSMGGSLKYVIKPVFELINIDPK